jgi:hypothetical protein
MRRAAVALAGLALVAGACTTTHHQKAVAPIRVVAPLPTDPPTTPAPTTTVPGPPPCPAPGAIPAAAQLASPGAATVSYSSAPGGPAVGHLARSTRWAGPTSLPVIGQQNGWLQVALPTRPNGSTGWVQQQNMSVTTTAYHLVISICRRSLTVYQAGQPTYSAPVGVGRPQWSTPTGPTFVDTIVSTPRRQLGIYGPYVLIMGTHSNVFTEFDGGDGTVAIHGYPSDPGSTAGVASSHGCVRANPQTIDVVRQLPAGTPIDIIA